MIAIIGAGPVGCFAAQKLAKKGYSVKVYEEHPQIGKPVQCTGLLTSQAEKKMKIHDRAIVNRIKKVRLHSPDGNIIEMNLGKDNIVVDRERFDRHVARLATDSGAKIYTRSRFEGIFKNKVKINNDFIEPELLVGADGPMSLVAKSAGMFKNRKFVTGAQARVEKVITDKSVMDIWLGMGCFSWLVPESESIGRLGVVDYRASGRLLETLIKMNKAKVIEYQGGVIPLYNPEQKLKHGDVALIGDAATQVKPTTFGGIVPGLLAARELARDIEGYEANCRKAMQKDLWMGLKIRNAMDNFSEQDYNSIVKMVSSGKAREILETHDRDFPSRFAFKLLLARPQLARYALKALLS